MNSRTYLKSLSLLAAALGMMLMPFSAQAQQTTESGTTLQDLQGGATVEAGRTLPDLQGGATVEAGRTLPDLRDGAATSEAARNSNATGSIDSPTVDSPSVDTPAVDAAAPDSNENVIARLSETSDSATVQLTNNTGAEITYEVIGQTQPRTLAAGAIARLDALPLPTTITAEREDFGLVDIGATVSAAGILEVSLERSEFDEVQGALHIREDGYVLVN